MRGIVFVCLFGLSAAGVAVADERDDWLALSLEPILDPAVTLVFHGDQGSLVFEDDEFEISVLCHRGDVGVATTFSVRIVNKSRDALRFRERMVSFHGSDDSRAWDPLPLVPAAESTRYCQRMAGRGRLHGPPPTFLQDGTVGAKQRHGGMIEYGHRARDPEYRYYRLSISVPSEPARFHFENVRFQGPDPRPDPRQPGFGHQWRRRHRGGGGPLPR